MKLIKVDNDPEPLLINEKLSSVKLNNTSIWLFLSLLCSSIPKLAFAQTSANIGLTSNYLWRGVSQSEKNIALSAGLDFANDAGFYIGTWSSTLSRGKYELDLYTGFKKEFASLSYNIGIIDYHYPNDSDYFDELYFTISKAGFSAGVAYTFNSKDNNSLAFSQGDIYYSLSYSTSLEQGVQISSTLGHYDFDNALADDYNHIKLAANKYGVTFAIDTTFSLAHNNDTTLSLAWMKTFKL